MQTLVLPYGSIQKIFKKTTKDDLLAFTFEAVHDEMKQRCPLFHAVLMTASIASHKSLGSDLHWQTTVCTAAAVCFKNRSQRMIAVQLLVSLIIDQSSYSVSQNDVIFK